MYCVHCGTEAFAKFCGACGKEVEASGAGPTGGLPHPGFANAAKPPRKVNRLVWRIGIPIGILFVVFQFVSWRLASVMPQ